MTDLDPDQLLKSLDAEIAMAKFRRSAANPNRNVIRMAGILILVVGTAAALLVLQYMMSEIPASRPAPVAQAAGGESK